MSNQTDVFEWDTGDDRRKDKLRILYIVGKYGASYPSEIAREMDIDADAVADLVHELIDEDHLTRLIPSKGGSQDPRLLRRRPTMWARGIKGLDRWKQITWVGLADHKILHLQDGRTVDPVGREIPVVPDDTEGPLDG